MHHVARRLQAVTSAGNRAHRFGGDELMNRRVAAAGAHNPGRYAVGFLLASSIVFALASALPLAAAAEHRLLKIGDTGGPHTQVLEQVKKVAEKDGLELQVVELIDGVKPKAALAAGELDAHSDQHKPCLDQQVKDRG